MHLASAATGHAAGAKAVESFLVWRERVCEKETQK
jgi:hypothetical protein